MPTNEEEEKLLLCNGRCNFVFQPTETQQNVNEDKGITVESVNSAILLCSSCSYCRNISFVESEVDTNTP